MWNRSAELVHPPALAWQENSLAERWAFRSLVGFVATQGYLVPLFATRSLNWAFWPSLPDIFGFSLVLMILFVPHRTAISPFNRSILKALYLITFIFILNFLFVTLPLSTSGEGVKFGGYSIFIFIKFVAVYWAAAQIPLDKQRMRTLHKAALVAFLWLTLTTLADRFYLIEINDFTRHLPADLAGKWKTTGYSTLNSTVSNSHGGTTVVILLLSALVLGTASQYGRTRLLEIVVFVLSIGTIFISGSRQGLVRILTFTFTYLARKPGRSLLILWLFVLFAIPIWFVWGNALSSNSSVAEAINRQRILTGDPFSDEGLSGRPSLWLSVIKTLNKDPFLWLSGYGIGNYVEYENASHNMFLRLLQEGGLIELIYVGLLWVHIFRRIWSVRQTSWTLIALSFGIMSSLFTSDILAPTLATGWYLGLFFVSLHILTSPLERVNHGNPDRTEEAV